MSDRTDIREATAVFGAIKACRPYLPSQGPIDNFIHHNTFHDLEHLNFEIAVEQAAETLGGEPYLTHEEFRAALLRGRIMDEDLDAELSRRYGAVAPGDENAAWERRVLTAALKVPELAQGSQTMRWWLEEGGGLEAFDAATGAAEKAAMIARSPLRTEPSALTALWVAIERRLRAMSVSAKETVLPRSGKGDERSLDDLTIRLVSAYLDRGTARWHMPHRERGLWYGAVQMAKHSHCGGPLLVRLGRVDGLKACTTLLRDMDASRTRWPSLVRRELLALPGWAGMIATLEERGELLDKERPYPALVDYLAARLLLRSGGRPSLERPVSGVEDVRRVSFAVQLFRVAQVMGLGANDVADMNGHRWLETCRLLSDTTDLVRRRILLGAYERAYRTRFLSALQQSARRAGASPEPGPLSRPLFQAMFCLDEREESFRRHLEASAPTCETFGVAGFFGIDMLYQAHDAAHPEPFCPAPVKPNHLVRESLTVARPLALKAAPRLRRGLKTARTRLLGAPLLPSVALWDASHMFLRLHVPRELLAVSRRLRSAKTGTRMAVGYSTEEIAERVASILRTVGLTSGFAKLVLLIGHGSTTTNNHFQSAYDCGACGGRRGQHNGRVFAAMANDAAVRALLASQGLVIPSDTIFVGGIHDTCSEDVAIFEADNLAGEHRLVFEQARAAIDEARRRNAHERYRRFGDTRKVDLARALAKVEARAHHAAEVRPEYGHGSNAASFVGRRATTRELFLDRRCFLTSYDAAQDPTGEILKGLLPAIMPVCAGISLEYYFSRVDNQIFGCGSKLPHNLVAMVGVVDGPGSDLRSGLPWQTVEIHEPMRLLTVIEGEVAFVSGVLDGLPDVLDAFDKGWGQLAVLSPSTHDVYLRIDGRFERLTFVDAPVSVKSSRTYYDGHREHLAPALIAADTALGGQHAV